MSTKKGAKPLDGFKLFYEELTEAALITARIRKIRQARTNN